MMRKPPRDALAVPSGDQQHKADTEKPGAMLAFSAFLRHRILGAAFVGLAAIANKIEKAITWRRQRGDEVVSHPADEEMDIPIAGFEQSRKVPRRD